MSTEDDTLTDAPAGDQPQAESKQSEASAVIDDAKADTGTEPDPDAEGEEGDADTEGDDDKPKRRSGIARLKRQLEIERAENAALRSRVPTVAADSESIARAVEAEVGPAPKEADYADWFEFERARTAYETEKRIVAREVRKGAEQATHHQSARQQALVEEFVERQVSVAKAIPDFRDVLAAHNVPVSPTVTSLILESEKGPLLQYHLAKNDAELRALNAMDPLSAARAIGRLEGRLSLPTANRNSKAPPPSSPLKGGAGPASDEAKLDAWLKKKYG